MQVFLRFFLVFSFALPCYARILLDDVMSQEEMQRTGVDRLNYPQQMALETWLNENFEPKESCRQKNQEPIFLTLNHHKGLFLEFSDKTTYQIAPEDRFYAAYWMTPFPAEFSRSGDSDYPVKITNLNTGTSVRGKEASTREILKEEVESHKKSPSTSDDEQPIQPAPSIEPSLSAEPIPPPTPPPTPEPTPPKHPNTPPKPPINQ